MTVDFWCTVFFRCKCGPEQKYIQPPTCLLLLGSTRALLRWTMPQVRRRVLLFGKGSCDSKRSLYPQGVKHINALKAQQDVSLCIWRLYRAVLYSSTSHGGDGDGDASADLISWITAVTSERRHDQHSPLTCVASLWTSPGYGSLWILI